MDKVLKIVAKIAVTEDRNLHYLFEILHHSNMYQRRNLFCTEPLERTLLREKEIQIKRLLGKRQIDKQI